MLRYLFDNSTLLLLAQGGRGTYFTHIPCAPQLSQTMGPTKMKRTNLNRPRKPALFKNQRCIFHPYIDVLCFTNSNTPLDHSEVVEQLVKKKNTLQTMVTISAVKARQIFDSRGNPTVEVCLVFLINHYMFHFSISLHNV